MFKPNRESALLDESSHLSDGWDEDYYRCRFRRWDRFETELRDLLTLLLQEQRRFVIISQREGNRYVQFAVQKDGAISAEAVSNKFLAGPERLSQAACRKMLKLSWGSPGKRSPNFWKRIRPPIPVVGLASLGVRTLREVFHVLSPLQLDIRRGVFQPKTRPKRQPKLRRTRDVYEFSRPGPVGPFRASMATVGPRAISGFTPAKISVREETTMFVC